MWSSTKLAPPLRRWQRQLIGELGPGGHFGLVRCLDIPRRALTQILRVSGWGIAEQIMAAVRLAFLPILSS